MAQAIVVTNAGPLIALGKLNRLDLLASLFGKVQIPRAVYREVVIEGLLRIEVPAFAQALPDAMVLLDDEVARAEARRLGLLVRGTLGIVTQSWRQDLLSLAQVDLLIREMAARPGIWIFARDGPGGRVRRLRSRKSRGAGYA